MAALKAGVHLKIVSARLGHASETLTASVYQHALPGMDREAAGTVAALFVDHSELEEADSVSKDADSSPVSKSVIQGRENALPDDL